MKTTTDSLPYILKKENIDLFKKHGIYSEHEVKARYDIQIEEYAKLVNIEVKTMLDLSEKEIIPACIKYLKEIADSENKIGLNCCNATSVIKNDIAKLIDGAFEQLNLLRDLKVETQKLQDITERANQYTQKVIPVMNCLRDFCDDLEKKIPSGYWPFPNYAEILFRV